MKFDIIGAFCVVLIILWIGEFVASKTKAIIPSVFVSAILFLLGFWTFLPKNLIDLSGLGMPLAQLSMYLLITHMGTMLDFKELAAQWKTVVIAAAGLVGVCLFTLTIGRILFGWKTVVIGTPPLSGGIVASIMMADAATAKGMPDLAVLAVLMYVMQGFAGYPLTAICLKKESRRLLKEYRSGNGEIKVSKKSDKKLERKNKFRIFPPLPKKYQTPYMLLGKLGLVSWGAVAFETVLNGVISKYVLCLIFGVLATELGFLERKSLNLSGSFGFLMTALMAFIFAGLSESNPQMIVKIAGPLFGIIILGVIGLAICSMVAGKILGYTKEMAFSLALTALYGFPPNYVLTEEASNAMAETEEEKQYLMDNMLPQMLVGGFITVTIGSVIVAGIFINLI